MPFISGRANKLDIINYQKEMSKNNLIINVGNLEAKKKKLDIKILFCQYDREKNSCLLFFISKKKNILNFFFKYLKKLLKLRKIKYIPISSRDRAKIIGGIGSCGRKFCCNICKEITNFKKKNKLFLKNEKTLGFCNCLKCCLFFDDDNENK